METFLKKQEKVINGFQQLWTNFKKDGPNRKSREYIDKKIDMLDIYWSEFKRNHDKLLEFEDQNFEYFSQNHYEETRKFYEDIRSSISKFTIPSDKRPMETDMPVKPSTSQDQPTAAQVQPTIENPTSNINIINQKLNALLRKQETNFKAFEHSLKKINLASVQEKWEYEDILKNIESRWTTVDKLHWEIDLEKGDFVNVDYEITFSYYEKKYLEMKKLVNSKLFSASQVIRTTPVLDIPEFNGSYQQWVSFKDLFSEAIHNNSSLSNAQKMQFLKSKIKGEPERIIQHLKISSDNYLTCWELLLHRYNNKKLIFSSYMDTMLNFSVSQQATINSIKRIHDVTKECLNGIKNLDVDISSWDPILVYLLANKLDTETHNGYMESLKQPRELPSLSEFLSYLESKFTALEASKRKQEYHPQKTQINNFQSSGNRQYQKSYQPKYSHSNNKVTTTYQKPSNIIKCPVCQQEHGVYFCKKFLEMSNEIKKKTIEKFNLCINCLHSHAEKSCPSNKTCRKCNESHNTLIHDIYSKQSSASNSNPRPQNQRVPTSHIAQQCEMSEVLLATAKIQVQGSDGLYHFMRALIDQGSQVSLISENAAQLLKLPRSRCKGIITGVGINDNSCKGTVNIHCASLRGDYTFNTEVYIMKSLTRNLPSHTLIKPSWDILDKLELADPEFYVSQHIDILLGADIFSSIISEGLFKNESSLILQQTKLGWIICGKIQTSLHCNVVMNNVDEIKRFWEIEDVSEQPPLSFEEEKCIQFYKSTTSRMSDGKYQVRIPFTSNIKLQLGQSKNRAIAQLLQLENKFLTNKQIGLQYKEFMHEYLALGHMTRAYKSSTLDYYMPHHAVLRNDSSTTALRVVFNASQPTSSGVSLNDIMMKGPNLQKDLMNLLIKWRQYKIAYVADIEKMYRQIWIHEDDQCYQKIVWRDSPDKPLQDYCLRTLTYGFRPAPFLALMTLHQLAQDEREKYPESAKIIEESFYMDDLLHGSHSIESAVQLKQDLKKLMKSGGFNLRKWMSNSSHLLDENQEKNYSFKQPESTKTLGLHWDPYLDQFIFQFMFNSDESPNTKRKLLSEISKLFDPLGWITPISTKLKILFQNLWENNISWDEKNPETIHKEWSKIKSEISIINQFKIPRWLNTRENSDVELHGFCDASQKAYACVIYLKINHKNSNQVNLVVGKSKLVPRNKNISLPRLELCGALLLAKLMEIVKKNLSNYNIKTYGWVDSTAVLGWLRGNPDNWKVFVANRVRIVTEIMPQECWRYIKSAENPADCASRGILPNQLINHTLWWQGPEWLPKFQVQYQENKAYFTLEDLKNPQMQVCTSSKTQNNLTESLLSRYSEFKKLVHVTEWILRFIEATKKQPHECMPYLTLSEIRKSQTFIIKHVQYSSFQDEIKCLQQGNQVSSKSKILNLNPYLDKDMIMRIGGRLRHSKINFELKNPIILPHEHRFVELLISHAHRHTYHGGARVTLAFIRNKYWIVGGNNATKKVIRKCVKCKHQKPERYNQIMGDLPQERVNRSRPFSHTGLDFTGHIYVKASKGRGIKSTKGYVAIFICMVTKAVHLELVSDLTTSGVLAALRRMAARRGTPQEMYSDNGSNFVGANNVLQKEYQVIQDSLNKEFLGQIADMQIKWNFNAPSWPSAGGLWEAAVKSFKHHFKRVIGEQRLTYEELTTMLAQIEAILNSRPLCPLTEDPQDLEYLTPSHFLTGGPALTLVETEHDLRTRWQLTQKILDDVWKRWRAEYLVQLNSRCKWRQSKKNIELDNLVLIHEDNLPPGKWAMGRVVQLHPGADRYVRVVTLKTKNGLMKRPVVKLAPLLENDDISCMKNSQDQQKVSNHTSNPQESRLNKTKFKFSAVVSTLMFFLTFVSRAESNNIKVNQFSDNQTLFFDKISDMMLIKDQWKLVVYYNMDTYWHMNTGLKIYIDKIQTTCKTLYLNLASGCDIVLLQLNQSFSELEYYNKMLLSQHTHTQPVKQRRVRRGYINVIGNVANTLFGVLDENFAEQYRKDINILQKNQKHLAVLWKNQTSLVEAQYNLLKRYEESMNSQHRLIFQHIEELTEAIRNLKQEADYESLSNEFLFGAMIANNMLISLKTIQDTLINTVTNIYIKGDSIFIYFHPNNS